VVGRRKAERDLRRRTIVVGRSGVTLAACSPPADG